jgi:hypothetical protein
MLAILHKARPGHPRLLSGTSRSVRNVIKQCRQKTYFHHPQTPQPAVPAAPRSYGRIFLKIVSWGGGFFIGVSTGIFMVDPDFLRKLEDIAERKAAEMALEANMMAGEGIVNPELLMSHYFVGEDVQPETTETATMRLQAGSQAFAVPGGHVHLTELAANLPSHVTSMVSGAATADDKPPYQLTSFGIFDGQGSSVTSRYVGNLLVPGLVCGSFNSTISQRYKSEIMQRFTT